ncbi:hypothetical protein ACFFRR_003307 [Megaselia abdita]
MKKSFIQLFLIYLFVFHESSFCAPVSPTTEIVGTEGFTEDTTPIETTELLDRPATTESTSTSTSTLIPRSTNKPRIVRVPLGHDGVKLIKKKQLLSKEFHKLEEENSINYFPAETSTTSTTQKSTTATTTTDAKHDSTTRTSVKAETKTIRLPTVTLQPPTMQSKISDINYEIIESVSQTTTSKPEPAAIEIHINVSESFGSESENVEFSLGPQPHHLQSLGDDVTEENKIILGIESNQPIKAINSDDIFIPQIKLESIERDMKDKNNPTGTGRDSDTIFYISNTEVKVGEDGNRFSKKSPGKKDVSYIAESYIEVVESGVSTTQLPTTTKGLPSVVIEPVPENVQISIGELPPQIELKEIDYMPSEEGVGDIKYGSDLIDEENIKSFDSMYSGAGYPFGNGGDTIKFNSMKKEDMAVAAIDPVYGNSNGSSVVSEEDPNYIPFTDTEIAILITIAVVSTLILSAFIFVACRYVCRKVKKRGGKVTGDSSKDPLAEGAVPINVEELSTINQTPQDLAATTATSKIYSDTKTEHPVMVVVEQDHNKNLISEKIEGNKDINDEEEDNGDEQRLYLCRSNSQSCGSITTMTLKNNHLTIETEETNNLPRDTRETKVHYGENDSFVVEVSRGADSNQKAPNEEVLVHSQPENGLSEIKEEEEDAGKKSEHINCGLSQSDLSTSSSISSNKRYSYGNQELYTKDNDSLTNTRTSLKPTEMSPVQEVDKDSSKQEEEIPVPPEEPPVEEPVEPEVIESTEEPAEEESSPTEEESVKEQVVEEEPPAEEAIVEEKNEEETSDVIPPPPLEEESEVPPPEEEEEAQVEEQEEEKNEEEEEEEEEPAAEPAADDEEEEVDSQKEQDVQPEESTEDEVIPSHVDEEKEEDIQIPPPEEYREPTPVENEKDNDDDEEEEEEEEVVEEVVETDESAVIKDVNNEPIVNGHHEADIDEVKHGNETTDVSYQSLPDPPSTDEIKQFNEILPSTENQLDSLPPPPLFDEEYSNGKVDGNEEADGEDGEENGKENEGDNTSLPPPPVEMTASKRSSSSSIVTVGR